MSKNKAPKVTKEELDRLREHFHCMGYGTLADVTLAQQKRTLKLMREDPTYGKKRNTPAS